MGDREHPAQHDVEALAFVTLIDDRGIDGCALNDRAVGRDVAGGKSHRAGKAAGPGFVRRKNDVVRVYTKSPTKKEADYDKPYTLRRGGTLHDVAELIHRDLAESFKYARVWGTAIITPGTQMKGDYVIHDKDGRLHDVFVIGRFSTPDKAPQLACAGRPSRSKLQRDLDLALIKCDMDLDGRTWSPTQGGVWPTLPEMRASDVKMGQRLWVLGYPDVGGGGLRWSTGATDVKAALGGRNAAITVSVPADLPTTQQMTLT